MSNKEVGTIGNFNKSWKLENEMIGGLKILINKAHEIAENLTKAVEGAANTKLNIKDLTRDMSNVINQISAEEMIKMIESLEETLLVQLDGDIHTEIKSQHIKRDTREMATQTRVWHLQSNSDKLMEELLKTEKTEKHFLKIVELQWPNEVFKSTMLVEGSILLNEQKLAFWQEPQDWELCEGIGKMVKERYPDILDVEGSAGLLTITSKVTGKEGRTNKKERKLYKLSCGATLKERMETLLTLKSQLEEDNDGVQEIAIPTINGFHYSRKLLEYIFGQTKIVVRVYGQDKLLAEKKNLEEGIVIKHGTASYADLLRSVKTVVGDSTDGIKTVRKTREGAVLIVVDKKRGVANTLTEKLSAIQGATMKRTRDDRAIFNIFDLDELTTKEEIVAAVTEKVKNAKGMVEIINIRPTSNSKQIATLAISKEVAKEITSITTVRIGLAPCRIKERMDIKRCYRCWGFGHESKGCTQEDRRGLCLKCGESGHIVVDCKGEDNCPLCKQSGHRVGSGKCQAFRKALHEAETTRKQRNKNDDN